MSWSDYYKEAREIYNSRKTRLWVEMSEIALFHEYIFNSDVVWGLESGTAHGWSACAIAASLKDKAEDGIVKTFDIEARDTLFEQLSSVSKCIISEILPFDEGVPDAFDSYRDLGPVFIFIDGDHSYEGVQKDWNSVCPYLQSGDIVAFHDSKRSGVKHTISEILKLQQFQSSFFNEYNTRQGLFVLEVCL
jgi:predicted O-methyltransferase YrrM